MINAIYLLIKVLVASSGYITPEQVHLSWTANDNEMRVTWTTYFPISNYLFSRPMFCDLVSTWSEIESNSTDYSISSYLYTVRYIHTGIIKLESGCTYEYYVGSWLGYSETYSFNGRSPGQNDLEKTNILVVSDWGGGELAQYTKSLLLQQVKVTTVDAILHGGDIAYDLDDMNGLIGDRWLNMIQPIAAKIPYMTLPGNHDTGRNYSHYSHKFKMPENEANQASSLFYSFNIGRAHYIMLNTEVYFEDSAVNEVLTQNNWLKKDLAEANTEENREKRPWIIILTHRNLYCSVDWNKPFRSKNVDCGVGPIVLRHNLEELLYQFGVDLFIQAHVHHYERNTPIYKNLSVSSEFDSEHLHKNPKATIYITNGNAGNVYGHNDPISSTLHLYSVYSSEEFGYGRVVVHNKTHLFYEQFGAESKKVIDYVWVIKDKTRF